MCLTNLSLYAQNDSTLCMDGSCQPLAKYEIYKYDSGTDLEINTHTGQIRGLTTGWLSWDVETFCVNDKNLADGQPAKDGRFRLKAYRPQSPFIWLLDTDTGKIWKVTIPQRKSKCRIELVE